MFVYIMRCASHATPSSDYKCAMLMKRRPFPLPPHPAVITSRGFLFSLPRYGCTAYCAEKIVGAPKVYPKYCDNVNALVVRHYGPWWLMCPSVRF